MFACAFRSALLRTSQHKEQIFESTLRHCFRTTKSWVHIQSYQLNKARNYTQSGGVVKSQQASDTEDSFSAKGHGAVLLVEKLSSVSDSLIGLTAQQYGPAALLVTLQDKSFMELEEGVSLEKLMFSTVVRQKYHEHKPLSPGTIAQDITDQAFRPFVRIVGPGANGALQVRLATHADDDAPSFERQPDNLLSGLPLTTSLSLSSPAAAVRKAVVWLWPHGHVPPDRIEVRYADGTAVPNLDGAALLAALGTEGNAVTRFRFSGSAYVPGKCVVHVDGVPVRVLVNDRDAIRRGFGVGRLLVSLFVLASRGFYYIVMAILLAGGLAVAYTVIFIKPSPPSEPLGPGSRVIIAGPAAHAAPGVVRALLPGGRARVALDLGGEVDLPLDALDALPPPTPAAAAAATGGRESR